MYSPPTIVGVLNEVKMEEIKNIIPSKKSKN